MEEKEEDEDKRKKKKKKKKKKKARLKEEEEYEMTTGIIFTSRLRYFCTYDVEAKKVGEWCRGIIFASFLCCS